MTAFAPLNMRTHWRPPCREAEASELLHSYIVAKTQQVAGLAEAELTEEEVDDILESATEEELEEAIRAGFDSGKRDGTIVRPKGKEERDELARQIRDNRSDARSYARNASDKMKANSAKRPGESDDAHADRMADYDEHVQHAKSQARGDKSGNFNRMSGNSARVANTHSKDAAYRPAPGQSDGRR